MLVLEAKKSGLIPNEYWDVVPDTCPDCGKPLSITYNRKTLLCDNPYCDVKIIKRMAEMLSNFGIKGTGESYCEQLFYRIWDYREELIKKGEDYRYIKEDRFGISPLEIFKLPLNEYSKVYNSAVREYKFNCIQSVLSKKYLFTDVVAKCALPGLKVNANKLFYGCESFEDFYNKTNKLQELESYVNRIYNYGDLADNMIMTIKMYLPDFIYMDKLFKYKKLPKETIKIAITGEINKIGNMSRDVFVSNMINLSEGTINIVNSKALASVSYIIADSNNGSRTYNSGLSRQQSEGRKLIYTSEEFREIILRRKEHYDK